MDWGTEYIKQRWEILKTKAREFQEAMGRIGEPKNEKGENNPQDGKPQSIDEYLERRKGRQPFYKNVDPNKKPWE
jgi:hypothetical protein